MRTFSALVLLVAASGLGFSAGFGVSHDSKRRTAAERPTCSSSPHWDRLAGRDDDTAKDPAPINSSISTNSNRRDLLASFAAAIATSTVFSFPSPSTAVAEDLATTTAVNGLEMKSFVDPKGLFVLNIPKRFFSLRRSAKGDLPDEKTGSRRRGSSIFSAGDMAKAEVVGIEYFPVRVLLEEFGIQATGSLSTIPDIGEPTAVANLIALRRDKDRPGGGASSSTKILPNSVSVSPDGKELSFQLKTEVAVQKPELLLEQYGVSELYRITAAKASLQSNNGNMMAIFASALETDWKGPDGAALLETVNSFRALDQSNVVAPS